MPNKIMDLNVSPYYDSTQRELDKGYYKYMATEGQVLQNRELNVAQGLIYGNLRKVTDLIVEDGTIISGCNFINDEVAKMCTLYSGELYINGIIVQIPEKTWPYKVGDDNDEDTIATDSTYIYAEIASYVYDERDDKSLYDPAEKMENYGNAGGHRLKYEATVGAIKESLYNDSAELSGFTRVILYKLKDRHIVQNSVVESQINTPVYGKVYKQIAQNTYDASGDFIADGMSITLAENRDNPKELYNINISSGRAYVRGYMYSFPLTTTKITKAATDTTNNGNIGENKTFHSGTMLYYLNNANVANVSSVSGTIEYADYYPLFINSSSNSITISSLYPVNEIISIWKETTGNPPQKEVYPKSSYNVQGNTIIFTGQQKPSINDTLHVNFTYTGSLTLGENYVIGSNSNGYYIEFTGNGLTPADGKEFNVKYSWYLSRIDLLYIRQDGVITVKSGIPGITGEIKEPSVPAGALPLAMINVEPGNLPTEYVISNYNIYRVPTAQLQNMKKRIEDLEQNVALTKLESEAQSIYTSEESLTNLKNIFVDPIADFSKADINNPNYDATLDFFVTEVRLPQDINQLSINDVTYTSYTSGGDASSNDFGNGILHLDIVNRPIVSAQTLATNNIDIVPYGFKGLRPELECSPKKIVTVDTEGESVVVWLPTRVIYSSTTVSNWIRGQSTTDGIWNGRSYGWGSLRLSVGTHNLGASRTMSNVVTTTSYEETVLQTNSVDLIPQANIKAGELLTITGKDWPANSEIRLYLDDSVITPEFNNVIYTSTAPFIMPNDTSIADPNDSGTVSSITNNIANFDNILTIRRANVWQWQKVNLAGAENVWKLSHPLYTTENGSTDGISYYCSITSNSVQWYYRRENTSTNVTSISMLTPITIASDSDQMKWAKYLLRSPWLSYYVNSLGSENAETQTLINNTSNTEPLTGNAYPTSTNGVSSTKTTIITDSTGAFSVSIAIPSGVTSGTHTITAETMLPENFDPDYYFDASAEFSGEAYIRKTTSYIYKQKTELINTAVYNDIVQIQRNYSSDPVAQSFMLGEDQYLSGIDVYFHTLPWAVNDSATAEKRKRSIIFTLRTMENGYPTTTVLYQKRIYGYETDSNGNFIIQMGRDNFTSDGKMTPTHIEFDTPIYVEAYTQYAFTLGSDDGNNRGDESYASDGFHIYYAKMGERDVVTGDPVTLQPIIDGVMFSSSDGATWTSHQDSDVTYQLYGVEFSTANKVYYLNDIQYHDENSTTGYFSTMNISVDNTIFEDTDIDFEYAINVTNLQDYANWLPLTLEERYEFEYSNTYTSGMNLALKMTLSSTNNKMTPIVNLNTLEIYLAKYRTTGSYILNTVTIA